MCSPSFNLGISSTVLLCVEVILTQTNCRASVVYASAASVAHSQGSWKQSACALYPGTISIFTTLHSDVSTLWQGGCQARRHTGACVCVPSTWMSPAESARLWPRLLCCYLVNGLTWSSAEAFHGAVIWAAFPAVLSVVSS